MNPLSEREIRQRIGWGPQTVSSAADVAYAQDIALEEGDLALVSGLPALRQDLSAALCTALGADPLNMGFGFSGFDAIAQEADRVMLRERLRVAVVNLLRADPRIERVDQVLIGQAEIEAARAGQTTSPPPATYGMVDIEATFRLRGQPERVQLNIGSILGSG